MKNHTLSRRYAKALYQVALETKTIDDVLQGLNNLDHALKGSSDLNRIFLNPLVKSTEKQGVVKTITSNKLILKFIEVLAKRKRLDLLGDIYSEFLSLTDEAKGIQRVSVKTALSLSESQKKEIEKSLAKVLGGKVIGQFAVAKHLIGGVWIKMSDKVLDATVKRRIEDMRNALVYSAN